MNPRRPSRRIGPLRERSIPIHCPFRRAGNALSTGHGSFGGFSGEEFLEYHAVSVAFFGCGGVVWVSVGSAGEHLVGDFLLSYCFEVVDPSVSDTITKLLLLSPQNIRRQIRIIGSVKRLPNDILLNPRILLLDIRPLHDHLFLRIQIHRHLEKIGIQKGRSRFHSPSRHGLIATQAIVHVKPADLIHRLVEKLLFVGSLMKVKIAAEYLIGSFPAQHHLNPHGLDLPRHEIHRSRSPNGGNIVRFDAPNHLPDGIGTLFDGISIGMVNGPEKVGDALGGDEVGAVGESYGEGVKFGEGGGTASDVAGADGGDEGRVEAAGEEDSPGDVGHHAAGYGFFEGVSEDILLKLILRWRQTGLHLRGPVGLIPPNKLPCMFPLIAITMPRRKILKLCTFAHKTLHLARHVHRPVIGPTDIKGRLPYVIPADVVRIGGFIIENETKHPTQLIGKIGRSTVLRPQWKNDLAIRPGHGGIRTVHRFQRLEQLFVIVNLPVGRDDDVAVARNEGLRTRLGIHDCEPFVGDAVIEGNARGGIGVDDDVAGPVGAAVAELGRAFDEFFAELI
mmetsp:Transcript_15412/g.31337  ORF Transcript_15412/g.31337 Transcript_15412/m.31337 type:complete len:562 (-) Transcript_15412:323-2008(-)